MAALPTPDEADRLLAAGAISPEQHQSITQQQPSVNGPMPGDPGFAQSIIGGGAPSAMPTMPAPGQVSVQPVGGQANDPFGLGLGNAPPPVINLPGAAEPVASSAPTAPPTAPVDAAAAPTPATPAASRPGASSQPSRVVGAPYNEDQEGVSEGQGIPSRGKPAAPADSGYDPRDRKAYEKLEKKHAGATQASADVISAERKRYEEQIAAQEREADARVMANSIEQAVTARNQENEAKRLAAHQEQILGIERASKEAADMKVDANHFYKEIGVAGSIMAAIAVGAGAFGAALNKGPNYAMEIINGAIARDIDAQKQNINQKWKGVDAKRGMLGDNMRLWGDERVAELHTKEQALSMTSNSIASMKAKAASEDARNNLDVLDAKVIEQREATKAEKLDAIELLRKQNEARAASAGAAQNEKMRKEARDDWKDAQKHAEVIMKDEASSPADKQVAARVLSSSPAEYVAASNNLPRAKQAAAQAQAVLNDSVSSPQMKAEAQKQLDQAQSYLSVHSYSGNTGEGGSMSKTEKAEHRKAQVELDGSLAGIDQYKPKDLAQVGQISAHSPRAWQSDDARKRNDQLDSYNSYVRQAVGASYKLGTNAMEPKNLALIEEQAKAYIISPSDTVADVTRKQELLRTHLVNSAKVQGIAPTGGASAPTGPNTSGFSGVGK